MCPKIPQSDHFLTTKFHALPWIMSINAEIVISLGQYCTWSHSIHHDQQRKPLTWVRESHSQLVHDIIFLTCQDNFFWIFSIFWEKMYLQADPHLQIGQEAHKYGFTTSLGCWLVSEKGLGSRGLSGVEKIYFF